jgi:ankyrin repeat protein
MSSISNRTLDIIQNRYEFTESCSCIEEWMNEESLNSAARIGNVKEVVNLLEQCTNINSTNIFGETPLFVAVKNRKVEVVKVLLSFGANKKIGTSDGETPASYATKNCYVEIAKILRQKVYRTPCLTQAKMSEIQKDSNSRYSSLHSDIIKYLILPMIIHDANDLLVTIGSRCDDTLTSMVKKSNKSKILNKAIKDNNVGAVKALLFAGVDCNLQIDTKDGMCSPLSVAAQSGHTEIARLLFNAGAPVDGCDGERDVPLAWAVEKNKYDMAKLLLDLGADIRGDMRVLPDSCFEYTPSPLRQAYLLNPRNREMIKLIKNEIVKIDVNIANGTGETFLMERACTGCDEAVKWLLEMGANVNAINIWGETALFYAIIHSETCDGMDEVVQILLEAGINVNLTNNRNQTVLDRLRSELATGCFTNRPELYDDVIAMLEKAAAGDQKKSTVSCL